MRALPMGFAAASIVFVAANACATTRLPQESSVATAERQAQAWDQEHQPEHDALTGYARTVEEKIEAAWKKPTYSGSQPVTVRLSLDLDSTGRLIHVEVIKPSGYEALDQSVLDAVKRAEPYPPFTPEFHWDHLRFPIEMQLTSD